MALGAGAEISVELAVAIALAGAGFPALLVLGELAIYASASDLPWLDKAAGTIDTLTNPVGVFSAPLSLLLSPRDNPLALSSVMATGWDTANVVRGEGILLERGTTAERLFFERDEIRETFSTEFDYLTRGIPGLSASGSMPHPDPDTGHESSPRSGGRSERRTSSYDDQDFRGPGLGELGEGFASDDSDVAGRAAAELKSNETVGPTSDLIDQQLDIDQSPAPWGGEIEPPTEIHDAPSPEIPEEPRPDNDGREGLSPGRLGGDLDGGEGDV